MGTRHQLLRRGRQGRERLGNYQTKREKSDLGKFRKGVWTDWIFHLHWSYKSDGLVEIWQNGRQVLTHRGPNCYHDPNGPYFKIGIYHPSWKKFTAGPIPARVIYHDEIRVADHPLE